MFIQSLLICHCSPQLASHAEHPGAFHSAALGVFAVFHSSCSGFTRGCRCNSIAAHAFRDTVSQHAAPADSFWSVTRSIAHPEKAQDQGTSHEGSKVQRFTCRVQRCSKVDEKQGHPGHPHTLHDSRVPSRDNGCRATMAITNGAGTPLSAEAEAAVHQAWATGRALGCCGRDG